MKKILSKVTLASRSEIVSLIDSSIREHSKLNVVTANPEIFMISESNEALQSGDELVEFSSLEGAA